MDKDTLQVLMKLSDVKRYRNATVELGIHQSDLVMFFNNGMMVEYEILDTLIKNLKKSPGIKNMLSSTLWKLIHE